LRWDQVDFKRGEAANGCLFGQEFISFDSPTEDRAAMFRKRNDCVQKLRGAMVLRRVTTAAGESGPKP
jgi:hypothetical protein